MNTNGMICVTVPSEKVDHPMSELDFEVTVESKPIYEFFKGHLISVFL